ncbi:tetratricopeptide repeat protein [bacterium]|nr:tetratricopeptide repeat protein [bacterium]
MMDLPPADRLLFNELKIAIELNETAGGLLLVEIPNTNTIDILLDKLQVSDGMWKVDENRLDPLAAVSGGSNGILHIILGIADLDQKNENAVLRRLNTRREVIPKTSLLCISWLLPPWYDLLVSNAKDFWAFRAAHFVFQGVSRPQIQDPSVMKKIMDQIERFEDRIKEMSMSNGNIQLVIATEINNYGIFCFNHGFQEKAKSAFEKTITMLEEIGLEHREMVRALNGYGNLMQHAGNWKQAEMQLNRAIRICKKNGDLAGESVTSFNIAWIMDETGRIRDAIQYVRRTVEINRIIDHPDLGRHLNYLNQLLEKLKNQKAK